MILMQGAPEGLNHGDVVTELQNIDGIKDIHHVHIWLIHEKFRCFEAHIKIDPSKMNKTHEIKVSVKNTLKNQFKIQHATIEIELESDTCPDQVVMTDTCHPSSIQ